MPRKNASRNTTNVYPRHFKSEAEEAEWLASPEGKRFVTRSFKRAEKEGRVVIEPGLKVKRTDPAVLQKLYNEALAKSTKLVSMRIPLEDLETARTVAAKRGIGYQTVLKTFIREGAKAVQK